MLLWLQGIGEVVQVGPECKMPVGQPVGYISSGSFAEYTVSRSLKAMSHSHYVQFAHVPRMKFWSYVDIRGKTEKSLGLYVKFSQMYHE